MQDNLFSETGETITNGKIENDERHEMDPNIDDNVFEEVTETKVDAIPEEISTQKSLKALLNVAKKTKKTTDRPGSELSFQSVNEISSIGRLNRIISHVYIHCLFRWFYLLLRCTVCF